VFCFTTTRKKTKFPTLMK